MLQTHSFMGVPACACFLYVHTTRNYIFLTCMHARVLITRLRWLTVLFKLSDRFQLCLLTPLFLNFSHHHNNASYNSYTDTAGGGGEGGREALSLCVHVQYCYWCHTILFNLMASILALPGWDGMVLMHTSTKCNTGVHPLLYRRCNSLVLGIKNMSGFLGVMKTMQGVY